MSRKSYAADVSDEEWAFIAPYLALMNPYAPQRTYPLREVFNGLRYVVKTGCAWRDLPHDLPPWDAVYYQTQRWMRAGVFERLVQDWRELLHLQAGRTAQPTAAILDSRTLQSTPESGAPAGYDGAKRRKGTKVPVAVDTLGHLLALHVTPANEQDRAQVDELAAQIQEATGKVSNGPMSIKAIPANKPEPTRRRAASSWKWSNCRPRKKALCCCRAAGWRSARPPGLRVSGAWRGTTNGCRTRWPGCIW